MCLYLTPLISRLNFHIYVKKANIKIDDFCLTILEFYGIMFYVTEHRTERRKNDGKIERF